MRPRGTDSGFDAGDSAFAVVGDPDRGIADGDGAGFGADLDRGAAALAAFEVDPGHRVLSRAGDPDGAVAGVDPTRLLADFDRVAEHGVDRGVDLGHAVGTAVGDPDEAVGDGDSGGPAADRDRRVGAQGAEVDPADAAGRGAADPEAALPDRQPQRLRGRRAGPAAGTGAPGG